MIVNLFAGPGGLDQAARVAGIDAPIYGYDIDQDACDTATAAGFRRTLASVTDLDPEAFPGARGYLITPPCPPFSRSGLGKGMHDFPAIRDAITLMADNVVGWTSDQAYLSALTDLTDPRSALVAETMRFAFRSPGVEWVVAEQVPGVAPLWKEIGAELAMAMNWEFIGVATVASEDLGVASRRSRTFLIATRHYVPDLTGLPVRSLWTTGRFLPPLDQDAPLAEVFPVVTMAQALGWPRGEFVNTRGNRRATGGNLFSADVPAWCLTEKARTWFRVSDGLRLTEGDAGLLMGFPKDHPWAGSRSKCFLQAADAVSPVVGTAVLGATLGRRNWPRRVRDYLATLYPSAAPSAVHYTQPSLFEMEIAS